MSLWKFILINSSGTETEIDNPQGWNDVEVKIDRDDKWHGIFFSYIYQELRFYGTGASLIKTEYEEKGVDGDMEMSVLFQCSDGETYDEFYRGRLAFDEYSDTCGDECIVTISLQDSNDIMLMRNNYEQKVNLNSNIAFDQTTVLTDYDKLNVDLSIPSRGIPQKTSGESDGTDFDIDETPIKLINTLGTFAFIRPSLTVNIKEEIVESDLSGSSLYYVRPNQSLQPTSMSPLITLKTQKTCYNELFNYTIRLKGTVKELASGSREIDVFAIVNQGQNASSVEDPYLNRIQIVFGQPVSGGTQSSVPFDVTMTGQVLLLANTTGDTPYYADKISAFISVYTNLGNPSNPPNWFVNIEWDPETSVDIQTVSQCDPTISKSYFINEVISRTVESITNNKIKFYSTFFGRPNSEPYSIPSETCAGAFAITNGLNIRRRTLTDGTQPGFFVTMKQLFDNLNSIWNIGLSIEPDLNRPGFNRLRFEDWRYFYQDQVGMRFLYPTNIRRSVDTTRVFNRMIVGYNKWTAGEYSGLDEFMTIRNFRININALSRELSATTDFVCSPYTIEITRRLDTGTDDWQYDNDVFGFCLKWEGEPTEYSIETFADVAYEVSNVNEAEKCYNGRISPFRMAMRWFSYVMQGIRNIQTDSKLIFTGGEANYIAKFGLNNCNIEGAAVAENESIEFADFENPDDAKPILFPEVLVFDHPLNFNLFKRIKNEPTLRFKSIEINCNGTMIPAWLKSISYKPEEGQATITAIPKNNSVLPEIPGPEPCQASIVEGSVTMGDYDFEAGTAVIDFTEGNAGATLWSYIITQGETPGAGTGFNGTTTEHPFTVGDLTPGTWSVFIVPYCSPDQVGINYGAGTFELEAPPFSIELTATLTNFGSNNHLVLTARSVGDVPAPSTFSFQWGQCVVNTSIPTEACRAYPGSPLPSPTNTLTFNAGQTTVTQQSVTVTAGSSYGYITKVVLYNLSGITSADISKAAGQGWTLQFM